VPLTKYAEVKKLTLISIFSGKCIIEERQRTEKKTNTKRAKEMTIVTKKQHNKTKKKEKKANLICSPLMAWNTR